MGPGSSREKGEARDVPQSRHAEFSAPKMLLFCPKKVSGAVSLLAEGQEKVLVGLEGIWDWEEPQPGPAPPHPTPLPSLIIHLPAKSDFYPWISFPYVSSGNVQPGIHPNMSPWTNGDPAPAAPLRRPQDWD